MVRNTVLIRTRCNQHQIQNNRQKWPVATLTTSIMGRIEIAGVERSTLNQMKGQHSEQRICLSPNNTTQPHSRGSNLGWPGMGDDGSIIEPQGFTKVKLQLVK